MQERAHHIGDFNYDAQTDFGDVNPFVEAIASSAPARYVPVWTWIEGLQPSGAPGATEIMAAADTDNSGTIDQDDADPDTVVVTVHEAEYGSPPAWGAGRQISPFSVVNLRNGNVLTAIPIFGWDPVGPPVQFTLYHNSTVPQGGTGHGAWGFDLGEGWSVSYGAHIEGVWGDPQVTVVEDDGTRHVYVFEQNQYTAPPGVHDLLTWDGQEEQWALTTPGQWVSTFNDAGFLTSVTDNTGNTLAVHRTNGRIDYIASAADSLPDPDDPPNTISHKLELLYDQNGKLTEIQFDREDFILKWRFEYETSGAGRLRKVHYPDYCDPNVPNYDARFYVPASHVEITYEQGSDRIAAIYPRDATGATNRSDWDWQYTYQDGRLTSVNTPKRNAHEPNNPGDRYTESFDYSGPTDGLWTTTHTDRRENDWLYRFDGAGNLREITTPAAGPNNTRSATYDADHNLLTRTDELGHTWTYTYGPVGNVETITSPLTTPYTQTWTLTWEWPNGQPANLRRLVKVQDPADGANDFVVQYEYDDPNHPTLVTGVVEPADGEGNGEATTEITYYFDPNTPNARGQLQTVTDANGVRHEFWYDKWGYFYLSKEGLYIEQQDDEGEFINSTNTGPNNNNPSGSVVAGRGGGEGSDPCAALAYDVGGNVRGSACCGSRPGGDYFVVCDLCSPGGQDSSPPLSNMPMWVPYQLTGCGSELWDYTYDLAGRPTLIPSCMSGTLEGESFRRDHGFTYDALGRRLSSWIESDESGTEVTRTFNYTYDPDGRLETVLGPDAPTGPDDEYVYDDLGRL